MMGFALVGLLVAAAPAMAQDGGLLARYLGDGEDAVTAAYLWIDTFHVVGDALAGLEQAGGLPADEMTISLGSYYDEPLPAGDELARRGLAGVARSGSVAAARLGDTARMTALFAPADSRSELGDRLLREVGGLQAALQHAAALATEALVCDGVPAGAATACGDPVEPSEWLRLRDQIVALSSDVEHVLSGTDVPDADD